MVCFRCVIVNTLNIGDNKDDDKSEMKKKSLRKCCIKKKEKWDQVIEEVKQNVSAKAQRLCVYMNLQNKNIRNNGVNRL